MFRPALRAALAGAALLAAAPAPAGASATTTVHYSGEFVAYITAIYRPDIDTPTVPEAVRGVTKAECLFDATGTSQTGIYGTFVAKVVTSADMTRNSLPQDNLPVATGIECSVTDPSPEGDAFAWTAVRPGNAAADARVEQIGTIQRPEICVRAWVLYSDGYVHEYEKVCRTA